MVVPANRVPVRIARGTKTALDAALTSGDLKEGEIAYANDEDKLYIVESATLIPTQTDLGTTSIDLFTDVDISTVAPTDGQGLVWVAANSQFEPATLFANVVEDTTPQLGGDLDVQTSEINTSTVNGNVKVAPNGTGALEVRGNTGNDAAIQLNCEQNTHGVKIKSPPHSAGATYTLTLPNDTGATGQALTTDGSGGLSWSTPSAVGSIDDLSDVDTTTVAPTDGQALVWDNANSQWEPGTVSGGGGATAIDDLTDVDTSTVAPTNGQVLTWDDANSQWEPATPSAAGLPTANDGEALIYEDGQWVAGPVIGGVNYSTAGGDPDYNSVEVLLHFDGTNGSTTFTDDSKNSWSVSAAGAAQLSTTQSKFGGASLYSGTNTGFNAAAIADADALTLDGDFTIEAWVYNQSVPVTLSTVVSKWESGGQEYNLLLQSDNSVSFGWGPFNVDSLNSPLLQSAASSIAFNTWYHLAVTRSGNDFRLFIDGTQVDTATNSAAVSNLGRPLNIGAYDASTAYRLDGYIDDVRITKGVARYTANFTAPTAAFPNQVSGSTVIPYSIDGLDDVDTSTVAPTNGQVLTWDDTTNNWEPATFNTLANTAWTPDQLTLSMWLDADDATTITEAAGAVSQWNDKTANGFNVAQPTSANQPTLTANGLNGKSVITFDGNDYLEVPANIVSQPFTVAIVVKANSTVHAGRNYVYDGTTTTDRVILALDGDPDGTGYAEAYAGSWFGDTGATHDTNPHIVTITYNGTSSTFRWDGGVNGIKAGNPGTAGLLNGITLGSNYNQTADWFQGAIAELIILPAVSIFEQEKIEGYLAYKWGLQGILPTTHSYKNSAPTLDPSTTLPPGNDGEALIWENGAWVAGPVIGGVNYTPSGDPLFSEVYTLLYGNGTNGSDPVDSSSNSHTLTLTNSPVVDTSIKKYGSGSISLGATGYITPPAVAIDANDFTLEFWVYWTTVPASFFLYESSPDGSAGARNNAFALYYASATLRYYSAGTDRVTSGGNPFTNATWHHVAITRESNVVKMFIDGTQQGGDYSAGPSLTTSGGVIGKGTDSATYSSGAFIDDFRLTIGTARYTSAFTPPTAELPGPNTTINIPYSIDNLDDVDTSTTPPTASQVLGWNSGTSKWEPATPSGLPAAQDGEALIYTNGAWVAGPVIGGVNYTPSGDPDFSNVSLLLHMDGTNGSTTFTDSSSNTFAQSSSTASLTTSELKFGTAGGDFTTSGHTVKFANDAAFRFGTGDFTIEGWFKPTLAGTEKSVCGLGTNTNDGFTIFLSPSQVIFRTSGTNDLTATVSISTTSFTHVAIVREGNTRNIYVDGTLEASDTLSFDISNTTDPFALGSLDTSGSSFRYGGYIDEFRVTKGVARYTSAFTVPTAAFPETLGSTVNIPYSIDNLDDVDTSTIPPTNGDILAWDSAISKWEPAAPQGLPAGADGSALIYEGGQWVVGPVIGGVDYLANDPDFSSVSLLLHADGTNASTTFTDDSPNGFTVTANGNAQISTAQSKFGGASAVFDGTDDYLSVPADADLALGTGDFTIECWYRPTSKAQQFPRIFQLGLSAWGTSDNLSLLDRHDDANTKFAVAIYNLGVNNLLLQSTTVVQNNVWYHLAVTRSGSTFRLFVDGVEEASYTNAGAVSTSATVGAYIGGTNATDGCSNGYVDELRVTKGVARYTADFTPASTAFPGASDQIVIPYSIDKLDDVDTSTVAPTDGDVLVYDNANTKFVPGVRVKSDTTQGGTGSSAVANIVTISQVDYDALATPDADTIYFIV